MLKSDLTKKLVEDFKKSFEEVLCFIQKKDYDKAIESIDDTFSKLFRLNSMFFHSMTEDNLIEILKAGGELEKDKAIIVSKLLKEKANVLELQGNENESFYLYLKSLNLYIESFLFDRESELIEFFSDIPLILDKISSYKLPKTTIKRLVNYYKQIGNFASGEDMLYELLDEDNKDSNLIEFGINYYEDLLKKDDKTLEKGNLPREEITDALLSLKKKIN
ncbi:tetratricopeptide (TPR) repeat protein [Clostridium tetanomorphum]|uniref:Uncharacterized protein n=1 Tax=Clostridium tetanomorphum TaxID=1553 RepID=A0A923ECR5_CLOTT|nr:DUF6483 family protein [Clostridium tetanomorphum]KAJ49794.1 hypothetical protein CTM_21291 [Clostridium tetanomorphum DSM 665]KAJ51064.1 hypothetical protein CTM_14803 [Clostridium tetanomorphum DSM 665]MBC2398120.1 hypothetical protein [Clostridium tetanomorphum]MBP1864689.1 tetratricopeptide (TPR) repeat protein [Clostridium tetanomorphum]NRS84159.1 tetratricopeptide (TPR) repeat protein [Clostridium tetanomorphum]